jgi:nucleotide-binding universal stress UspA family protein
MTSTAVPTGFGAAQLDTLHPQLETIVVATDGSADADHALQYADVLASQHKAALQVVSVCEWTSPPAELPTIFPPVHLMQDPALARAERAEEVRQQLSRIFRTPPAVTLQSGEVADEVAGLARKLGAGIIVTGRGKHTFTDRLLGEEHLAKLLRIASCPVLAVTPGLLEAPSRIVVGVDFSTSAVETAHAALMIAAPGARVYLVHATPDIPFGVPTAGSWLTSYDKDVRAALDRMRETLGLSPATTETVIMKGYPGRMLAEFADRVKADLLAVGTHGAGFVHRLVIGSSTTYLLRNAPCSLLAVPWPGLR